MLSGLLSLAFTDAGTAALLGEATRTEAGGTSSISVSFCISLGGCGGLVVEGGGGWSWGVGGVAGGGGGRGGRGGILDAIGEGVLSTDRTPVIGAGGGGAAEVNRLGLRSPVEVVRSRGFGSGIDGGGPIAAVVVVDTLVLGISDSRTSLLGRGERAGVCCDVLIIFLLYPPGRGFNPRRSKFEEKLTSKRVE